MKDKKLKAATFATNQFPWKETGVDDYICHVGDYCLRVEQMAPSWWWFNVSFGGIDVHVDQQMASSKYRAIGLCEGLYLGHKIYGL